MGNEESKKYFEKVLEFIGAARRACKDPDKIYTFTCPICGGDANVIKSSYNGHHHGCCMKCNIKFME